MAIFKATAIFKNGQYVFNDPQNEIDINPVELGAFTPRPVWVLRDILPGTNQVQYGLTFDPTSDQIANANTIAGLYVEQDGKGVVIDCISIDNFNTIANSGGTLQRRYGAAPAFTAPTRTLYCVTRADDGSVSAHSKISTDYIGQYHGNIVLRAALSGTSLYWMYCYGTPKAIGSDVIAAC